MSLLPLGTKILSLIHNLGFVPRLQRLALSEYPASAPRQNGHGRPLRSQPTGPPPSEFCPPIDHGANGVNRPLFEQHAAEY